MYKVSKKQREEWTENPVTIRLRDLVNKEVKEIIETPAGACLRYGDPHATHENLIRQDVEVKTLAMIHEALNGDWGYFVDEVDEDEE